MAQNAFELMSVRDGEQVIQIEDHYYRMRYYSVETQERHSKKENTSSGLMLYLTDITDYELLRQKYSMISCAWLMCALITTKRLCAG